MVHGLGLAMVLDWGHLTPLVPRLMRPHRPGSEEKFPGCGVKASARHPWRDPLISWIPVFSTANNRTTQIYGANVRNWIFYLEPRGET